MAKKENKPTKMMLIDLCRAHTQLLQTREEHARRNEGSKLLMEMFDQKIQELEGEITKTLKAWLGNGNNNSIGKRM